MWIGRSGLHYEPQRGEVINYIPSRSHTPSPKLGALWHLTSSCANVGHGVQVRGSKCNANCSMSFERHIETPSSAFGRKSDRTEDCSSLVSQGRRRLRLPRPGPIYLCGACGRFLLMDQRIR